MVIIFYNVALADCTGCCSYHGGVCCISGETKCCDGTSLSDTCKEKGCDVCGGSIDSDDSQEIVTIRLYGIDSPESNQPYGSQAMSFTKSKVDKNQVRIVPKDTDAYGRTVALVYKDNMLLNKELVDKGYAWVYETYCNIDKCNTW